MHSLGSSDHLSTLCPLPEMCIGTDTVTFPQMSGQANCPGILHQFPVQVPRLFLQPYNQAELLPRDLGEINSNKRKEKKKYLQ